MIVGDRIVVAALTCYNTAQVVEVTAIEKHEIVWRHLFQQLDGGAWYVENSYVYTRSVIGDLCGVTGRVSKRDRGLTWCPAWIDDEVELLRDATALRTHSL